MKPFTVGFLANVYDEPFANSPTNGFLELTRDLNVRFLMFPFPRQRNTIAERDGQNLILDAVRFVSVDGLIISGFFSHGVDSSYFGDFCRRFEPLPLVTLGVAVPGIPAVVTEIHPGMRALMAHLLDDHGYQRLGYLSGPLGQQEAEERHRVFRTELLARGRNFPESWKLVGDFSLESGHQAVVKFLETGPPPFEGLVCANDSMALGATRALEAAGLRVPEDVFVTGFDDYHAGDLTTVRQSSFLQMRAAVKLLVKHMQGDRGELLATIPSELVVRSSCRCDVPARYQRVTTGRQRPPPGSEALMQAFETTVQDPANLAFYGQLQRHLRNPDLQDPDGFLRDFEGAMAPSYAFGSEGAKVLERGRFQLLEHHDSVRTQSLHRLSMQTIILREFQEDLSSAPSVEAALEVVRRDLSNFGVRGCWLSLLDEPDGSLSKGTLRLAFDNTAGAEETRAGESFPSRELIPGGLKTIGGEHWLLMAGVLQSRDEVFGLLVLSMVRDSSALYESLRGQIGAALQSTRLWEERVRQEQRLIESEKMASLGNLVAGVAHEINTPLGVGITASSDMNQRTDQAQEAYRTGTLGKTAFQEYLASMAEEGRMIETNLTRAAVLVNSFKQIAVDQAHEETRTFGLADYLGHIVLSLSSKLRLGRHRCEIVCPADLTLTGPPGTLAQMVTNLIDNALVHAFPDRREGQMKILVEPTARGVRLSFSDNGAGIAAEHLDHVFEPFFTTRRGSGGTGLGLAIVYNLTVRVWNGQIRCHSQPGVGTTFVLDLGSAATAPPPIGRTQEGQRTFNSPLQEPGRGVSSKPRFALGRRFGQPGTPDWRCQNRETPPGPS